MIRRTNAPRPQGGPRPAVLYARVSSQEQATEGFSVPAQLRLLRSYAAEHDLTIAREFTEAESAKMAGRTAFGEMLDHLRGRPECERVIVVEKVDRLCRNLTDVVQVDELGAELHLAKEGVVISRGSKSSDRLLYDIRVVLAKHYVENLREECMKGMVEKATSGVYPSYAPLGYLNTTNEKGTKIITLDPDRAPIVREMFERYATGQYSLEETADWAKAQGLGQRGKLREIRRTTVHKILRRRFYHGQFEWQGEVYKGTHPPLVSRELWERVQQALDRRFEKRHRKVKHAFAFARLIECGRCGCSLVGDIKKRKYVYYRCTHAKGECSEPYVREQDLEEQFTDALRGLSFPQDVLPSVAEALRASHTDVRRHQEEAIARLEAQHRTLRERIDTMYVDRLQGRVDTAFFDRKATEWRDEQGRILAEIEAHQTAHEGYIEEGISILELCNQAAERFKEQNPTEKRRLLDFAVSNCTWADGQLTIAWRQPFDLIADAARDARNDKAPGVASEGLSANWYPHGDSNPGPQAENLVSWAPRRWGRRGGRIRAAREVSSRAYFGSPSAPRTCASRTSSSPASQPTCSSERRPSRSTTRLDG